MLLISTVDCIEEFEVDSDSSITEDEGDVCILHVDIK